MTHDFTEREDREEQRITMLSQDHLRLRKQFNWLIGLLIGMLLLIGILSAIALRLTSEKEELEDQVGSLTTDKAESTQVRTLDGRLNTLEQQIKSVNQRVPRGLPNQLKANQTQIQNLQSQVRQISTQITSLEQANETLQSQLEQQGTPSPSPTSAQ